MADFLPKPAPNPSRVLGVRLNLARPAASQRARPHRQCARALRLRKSYSFCFGPFGSVEAASEYVAGFNLCRVKCRLRGRSVGAFFSYQPVARGPQSAGASRVRGQATTTEMQCAVTSLSALDESDCMYVSPRLAARQQLISSRLYYAPTDRSLWYCSQREPPTPFSQRQQRLNHVFVLRE